MSVHRCLAIARLPGEEGGYYGTKHDANRILTVANSQWLIQRMRNSTYQHTMVLTKTRNIYPLRRPNNSWINIKCTKPKKMPSGSNYIDTDPELAANIVNEMVKIIDSTITAPIQRNKESMYVEMKKQLDSSEVALNNLASQIELYQDSAQNQLYSSI